MSLNLAGDLASIPRWQKGIQAALGPGSAQTTANAFYSSLATDRVAGLVECLQEADTRAAGLALLGRLLEHRSDLTTHIAPLCDSPNWRGEADRLTVALLLRASLA